MECGIIRGVPTDKGERVADTDRKGKRSEGMKRAIMNMDASAYLDKDGNGHLWTFEGEFRGVKVYKNRTGIYDTDAKSIGLDGWMVTVHKDMACVYDGRITSSANLFGILRDWLGYEAGKTVKVIHLDETYRRWCEDNERVERMAERKNAEVEYEMNAARLREMQKAGA